MSEKVYPDRAPTMYDEIIADNTQDGKEVYKHDCYNLPFCESGLQTSPPFPSCVSKSDAKFRCERADKMILFKLGQIERRLARLEAQVSLPT